MEKILKPYTIIPDDLYVQRDADKQVRNIIADMGRPGYVLVSRQMGKTNLLLYAKSKLETINDAFIYVDLSNTFPTAKSCFENIIDNAIEAYPEQFGEIAKVIKERRKELKDTPAHKQHTNELRFLLQSLKGGKMVIILDEIDALTKTDYSDQIFSQIRSTYFGARVNYKEFYNLTYLLSGVVEPSEIIKDPKVSPFNIGQKIYLNDFSRKEFDDFIVTAKLDISQESADRIFYWTNGNPRISWDVCSEVENKIKSKECNTELIDKIVQDLYLTSFDKAPIDNIREIVSNDRDIRNSIVEIEYKKGKLVSDKLKSKLYLAGIINYDEDDIHIKNEIIRQALNLDWIKSIEEEDKGLIKIALEYFEKEEFQESINLFERYLSSNDFEEEVKSLYYHYMGIGYLKLSQPQLSIDCFEKTDFDKDDQAKLYYRTLNLKGTAFYNFGKIEESLKHLQIVINSGRKDIEYARALINYGITCLKSSEEHHHQEAIKIFKGIIDESGINREKLKDSFLNELKAIAYLNLGRILTIYQDFDNAIINYKEAILIAKPNTKPSIILSLLEILRFENERQQFLSDLVDIVIEEKAKPIENDLDNPMDFSFNELRQICIIAFCESKDELFPKLEPHLSKLGEFSKLKHLCNLSIYSINQDGTWERALILLNYIYESLKLETELIDDETKYNTLKLLAYGSDRKELKAYNIEYINIFKESPLYPIDFLDMEIFINLIFALTEKKKYEEALKYVVIIDSFKDSAPEHNLINYLLVYHLQLNIYLYLNDKLNSVSKAEQILELANNEILKHQKSNLLGDTGLDIIKQNAESIIRPKRNNIIPIRSNKSYGRNQILKVRYKDGTILETKFKKIEKDIGTGDCMVLE